ncbi:MAG: site-specific integrase [Devosia sp.]|nr:site-specific integrase [Devosia sp.]
MKPSSAPHAASLYGRNGQRKYLTSHERLRFIAAAQASPRKDLGALCLVLAYSGCRISEALAMTENAINTEDGTIAVQSLKKRGAFIVREIPVPDDVLARLMTLTPVDARLWPFSRGHAWQLVKAVMRQANILPGLQSTPKGLRHGFGVHAIRSGIPITLVQRWLGHASLSTTAIYTQVLGQDEREIASRMW